MLTPGLLGVALSLRIILIMFVKGFLKVKALHHRAIMYRFRGLKRLWRLRKKEEESVDGVCVGGGEEGKGSGKERGVRTVAGGGGGG